MDEICTPNSIPEKLTREGRVGKVVGKQRDLVSLIKTMSSKMLLSYVNRLLEHG
jgi:hypothetical protein